MRIENPEREGGQLQEDPEDDEADRLRRDIEHLIEEDHEDAE